MTGRWLRRLALGLVATALSLGLLEATLRALRPDPRPGRSGGFWQTAVPVFGTWHRPGAAFTHRSSCFRARYTTNSVGARDRERERRADTPRTVVLGDSFIEGWGLPDAQRLSDRLEAASGREHLNFGMAHFSPYQSYLLYRELARDFDHDTVLLGITPENDFLDLSLTRATGKRGYAYAYRPYLVPGEDGYAHVDLTESALHRWLRRNTYALHVLEDLLAEDDPAPARSPSPGEQTRQGPRSAFYEFSDRGLGVLRHTLELLAEETGERRLVVVLLPTEDDLRRQRAEGGGATTPLGRALSDLETLLGLVLLDLLPAMAAEAGDPADLVFPCDYHWSAQGNALAARLVLAHLY